jgi:hypothetical protein
MLVAVVVVIIKQEPITLVELAVAERVQLHQLVELLELLTLVVVVAQVRLACLLEQVVLVL